MLKVYVGDDVASVGEPSFAISVVGMGVTVVDVTVMLQLCPSKREIERLHPKFDAKGLTLVVNELPFSSMKSTLRNREPMQ